MQEELLGGKIVDHAPVLFLVPCIKLINVIKIHENKFNLDFFF